MVREPLIFEMSSKGKSAFRLPSLDVPEKKQVLTGLPLRTEIEEFPEVSEVEVVRHFTRLSKTNYCVDEGFYPLGSCTMKYNPKINERIAALAGFLHTHPLTPEELVQGNLEALQRMEDFLGEITGMDAFTLLPSAGAQGELVGMMMIRACLTERGDPRKTVLIPDSAHGTNPSSAHLCGYKVHEIRSNDSGVIDMQDLFQNMTEDVAALMVTNPNTLGIFETDIMKISEIVHDKGGFIYMDGANMNALVGQVKPGNMNVDVIHLNLHKTFSTPHGGGGPGAGPVGVRKTLAPFLPIPRIVKSKNTYHMEHDHPKSIGRVGSYNGHFLVILKALTYILSLGPKGLKEVSEISVLNSNYIRKSLEDVFHLKYKTPTLHECVFSDKNQRSHGIQNLDIAKRLIDFGVHPPTMSFPLNVQGALMIEPTETESKRDMDIFIDAMKKIAEEAQTNPDILKSAPHHTYVRRLDETAAARNPVLKWTPGVLDEKE